MASVPTGIPAGIWTMDSKESRPLSAADSIGTPSTGNNVLAAATPGRCAAPPAPADDVPDFLNFGGAAPAAAEETGGMPDLFGTAEYGIDFSALSPNVIWYVQVAALLAGHVLGLTLAHDKALVYWRDYRRASRSQYWMLAVMVAFTCFGLYLLSVGAS